MSDSHITDPKDIVPLKQKLAVGAGGFPIQNGGLVVQYMAQPIFQIFLGLNPALFGLAMTIPRIWDAFTDPIMGRVSDRYKSKYGRRRPFVFVGAIAVALCFLSIWMVPESMGETGTFWWLTIGSVLFFTAFTVYSVPYNALVYEQTPDYHERTRLMFYLALFYNIGNLCVNWYVPATNWSGFENPLVGARWIAVGLSVFVFLGLGLLPAIYGKERFYEVAQKENNEIGFFKAIGQAASSKPMMGLVGIVFALNFCGTIAGSIAMYIVIYHVKSGDVAGGLVLNAWNGTGFAIVGFAGIFILRWLAIKFGKRKAMFYVLLLTALGGVSKWFIFTPEHPYLLLLDAVLNGPVWVSLGVIVPSMIADLCDWDEHKFGERREGIISSVFTWITKFGTSFTFLVSGIALHFSGFDEALGADQPEGTMTTLRIFFVGASVAAPVLAMFCLKLYNISEESAYQVRKELEERRGTV
ncbi:MFS transporter [Lentisphaera marina]|uniref:MFS transporter n=1 Tax=Lentisphaera marina TaxID=1111041 RepID=UPI002365FECA|nr:MFS transporter [Lentisphaera marina]MDD7986145.1 MFS transporter [Lentisphaera marina]